MRYLHPGDPIIIHYASSNQSPDPKWRERPGVILTIASGKPKNVLVQTDIGEVVIPYGNARLVE
jgi:hypothetical protein